MTHRLTMKGNCDLMAILRAVILGMLITATSLVSADSLAGKKIIKYGWDTPTTNYARRHVREMEKLPFDGVVIKVMSSPEERGDPLGWQVASGKRFTPDEYEHAISDLKATRFNRFKDNFIQVVFAPGVDWFDPEWSSLAYNVACLARVAREGGCKGIMLDCEAYGSDIWHYEALASKDNSTRTYEQYVNKVRERGTEFIRAINQQYPDLTLLCLIGPSFCYTSRNPQLEKYGLMYAFFEGMWEAASPGTTIVDGFEAAYRFKHRDHFQAARKEILTYACNFARNKDAYMRHVRAAYGLWLDSGSGQAGWHNDDFSKNYFTPGEFRNSLAYALEACDEYIWVYSERLNWWDGDVPAAYIKALEQSKSGPDLGSAPAPRPRWNAFASKQAGYSDDETFAEMRKIMTEIYDFPKDGWRFRTDPSVVGEKQGWFKTNFDDSAWQPFSIGKYWEEQGIDEDQDYDGVGWYRRTFEAPSIPAGKRALLAVGAADESAWVWLNGKFVGSHDIGAAGWNIPFTIDVTDALKPGEANIIAIKVHDRMQSGGLWKSIKLMTR